MTEKDDHEHEEGARRVARTDVEIDLRDGSSTRVVRRGAWPTAPVNAVRTDSAPSAASDSDAGNRAGSPHPTGVQGRPNSARDERQEVARRSAQPTPFLRPLRTTTVATPEEPTVLDDDFDEIDLTDSAKPLPHWTSSPTGEVPRALQQQGKEHSTPSSAESTASPAAQNPREASANAKTPGAKATEGKPLSEKASSVSGSSGSKGSGEARAGRDQDTPLLGKLTGAATGSTTSKDTSTSTNTSSVADEAPASTPRKGDDGAFGRFRRSAKLQGVDPAAAPSAEQFQKSSLATRVITGLLAAAVAIVAFANGPTWLMVIVFVVAFGAAVEFYDATRSAGFRPATALGILGVLGVVGGAWARGEIAIPAVLSLTLFFGFLWFILGIGKASPTANLAVTLLGVVWVGVLASFGALLLRAPDHRGVAFLGAAALLVVTYDTAAYLVGSAIGKRKLAPKISPSKTVEGLFGATVATLLMGLLILPFLHPWGVLDGLILAAVLCIVAPLGDLAESIVKRDLGVKDMGRILPGHGGILDRFDAILLALPVTYYVVIVLGLWSA